MTPFLSVADRQFMQDHLQDDLPRLLLAAHRFPGVQVSKAVAQIEALRKLQTKIPDWFRFDLDLPPVLSVEQASSATTARFKTGLFSGATMADLTGGMGVDAFYFAQQFERVLYVEQNPDLVRLARHNFDVLGASNIISKAEKTENFLKTNQEHFDLIYLDPARRDQQQKRVFRLSDCQPDVLEIKDLLLANADRVLLKTAPMLDLNLAVDELKTVSRIWVVSVDNECKEVLYLLEKTALPGPDIPIEAVCLGAKTTALTFTRNEEQAATPEFSEPLRFLYEPDAAVLKAGAFKTFALRFGLKKLHPNTQLYTSETYVPEAPGRCFVIEAVLKYDRKTLRQLIPEGRANLAARNFPDAPPQMRKKLGLSDGGDWYVFGAMDIQQRKVLIACRRASGEIPVAPESLPV